MLTYFNSKKQERYNCDMAPPFNKSDIDGLSLTLKDDFKEYLTTISSEIFTDYKLKSLLLEEFIVLLDDMTNYHNENLMLLNLMIMIIYQKNIKKKSRNIIDFL